MSLISFSGGIPARALRKASPVIRSFGFLSIRPPHGVDARQKRMPSLKRTECPVFTAVNAFFARTFGIVNETAAENQLKY
ncbi:MAG: hypothetical protein IOC35_05900 [Methylobacterium sp.]|jgi:hypothetical protein|nr:hypothetical protein [Methylobacterium sp.]